MHPSGIWPHVYCFSLQSYQFEKEVTSGTKRFSCSFTLVMKDEKTVDMEMCDIKCKIQQKKKMTIKDFVWTSKTMKKFTLSFTIQKAKTEIVNSTVEIG